MKEELIKAAEKALELSSIWWGDPKVLSNQQWEHIFGNFDCAQDGISDDYEDGDESNVWFLLLCAEASS